jgi:hypothetical protein
MRDKYTKLGVARGCSSQCTDPLKATIESSSSFAENDNPVMVFKLENPNDFPVWVLNYEIPSMDITEDVLTVKKEQEDVDYIGIKAKRTIPSYNRYVKIEPGQILVQGFDPSIVYAIAEQGNYSVTYDKKLNVRYSDPSPGVSNVQIESLQNDGSVVIETVSRPSAYPPEALININEPASVAFSYGGNAQRLQELQDLLNGDGSYSTEGSALFSGIPTERRQTVRNARSKARQWAEKARNEISKGPKQGSSRFLEWFGRPADPPRECSERRCVRVAPGSQKFKCTANNRVFANQTICSQNCVVCVDPPRPTNEHRVNKVEENFTKIRNHIDNANITFRSCNETDLIAYVYRNQPNSIWLCTPYWSLPDIGIDSKAGTIVHEVSHYKVTVDTDDYVYGTVNCRNLAISSPGKAIKNADSYEYFCETAYE